MPKPGRRDQPQPSNELARFTNRDEQRALFHHMLSSETEPPVLMFYGVGGNGKSWLLKKLREETPTEISSAFLDFDVAAGGQRFVLDPAAALYEIRHQLDRPAPRFDLAFAMLRHKQGVAGESGNVLIDLASELAGTWKPGAGTALKWLSRPVLGRLKNTPLERFLANATGTQLALELRARTSQEIGDKLIDYLAEDLRESVAAHLHQAIRAVLFFDTFEALAAGLQNEEHQRLREQWVKDIAANFDFALTVIAGQNQLTWAEADPSWADHLDQHLIGGLSETDARRFLADCEIGVPLQDAILATARETDGAGYHCYSLGLCADIVFAERRKGQETCPETLQFRPKDWEALARRFLKSLDSDTERRWIERLALTPRFDEAAARVAFSAQPSAAQDAEWEALTDYSFIGPLPGASPWFAVRSQMRWALENQPSASPRVKEDHEWWQSHWAARAASPVDDAASLAWYHRYSMDAGTALDEWSGLALAARASVPSRMQTHFDLLRWWEPVGLLDAHPLSAEVVRACCGLGVELWSASLGNRAANLRQAIACYEAALRVYTERDFPYQWAGTKNDMGLAWSSMPTGDRAANLRLAIGGYESALRVFTEQSLPQSWATTQSNLGAAWQNLPIGDRAENLRRAIRCYENAQRVRTEHGYPRDWALTQNNLGTAWQDLPTGDRAENLRRAIACYEAALRVRTEQDLPQDWATTTCNLGAAWAELPTGDRAANLQQAIACFEAALRVRTEADFPQDWAMTQTNMGSAWALLRAGDRAANLRQAIACFEAALRVRTEADFPQGWAVTQNNLGNAWSGLSTGDRAANLRQAIACYEAAMRVYTENSFPLDWAMTERNLGLALQNLPAGDQAANLNRAIACFEAALRVYTEHGFPKDWATTHNNLGVALTQLPEGDRGANMRQAIAHYEAALHVRNEQDVPEDWAMIQNNLGNAWLNLPAADRAGNILQAIACYKAAERVYTEQGFPQQWASTQNNLGAAWAELPTGDRAANMHHAVTHFESALRVYTEQAFPQEHQETVQNLQITRKALGQFAKREPNASQ
jgi:tetratricopeptide (TPR) repeat protein